MERRAVSFHAPLRAGWTDMNPANRDVIFRPHGMDAWILNLTVKGSGRINREENLFHAGKGDLLLFPPGVVHDYSYSEKTGGWVHMWVYFHPRPFWQAWMKWPESTSGVLRLLAGPKSEQRRIRALFRLLVDTATHALFRPYDFAMNMLEEILLLCDRQNPLSNPAVREERVLAALDYMARNFGSPMEVAGIARQVHLSESRFAHLFKEHMGVTPMAHLERVRISRAEELLIGTDHSIANIADEAGFANAFYFSRVFRQCTGRSPREFRKKTAST